MKVIESTIEKKQWESLQRHKGFDIPHYSGLLCPRDFFFKFIFASASIWIQLYIF